MRHWLLAMLIGALCAPGLRAQDGEGTGAKTDQAEKSASRGPKQQAKAFRKEARAKKRGFRKSLRERKEKLEASLE